MKKKYKIAFLIFFSLTSLNLVAQETIFEEARTIYKSEQAYGLIIHTTGWGFNYRYGMYTSGFTRRTFEGEIVGLKHPKEIKTFTSVFDNSNGYVFGKLNTMFLFRGSVGNHKTFISKQSVRGIAVALIYNTGITFAYAKPIYLEVLFFNEEKELIETRFERYDPEKHTQNDIIGKGPAMRGLFGGKFIPGVFLKAGLNFESAREAENLNALEVGIKTDLFLQKLPMMANELNRNWLINLYVTFSFGSKSTN
ncbi:MAG: hypothetical protein RQ875_03065 [Vicingaceae bacterium]|nr:hypothetical protein [Vicingaceae bacterium]